MRRNRTGHDGGWTDDEACDECRIRPFESPSHRTVRSVAEATGRGHDELRPLYDVIDPDALDELIGGSGADVRIEFRYEGCHVRVGGDRVLIADGAAAEFDSDALDLE